MMTSMEASINGSQHGAGKSQRRKRFRLDLPERMRASSSLAPPPPPLCRVLDRCRRVPTCSSLFHAWHDDCALVPTDTLRQGSLPVQAGKGRDGRAG